jgi:MinD-like ATPase involved in chromosome partitioning or flagellar assembly
MPSNDNHSLLELTQRLQQQYEELNAIIDAATTDSPESLQAISEQMQHIKQTEMLLVPLRQEHRRSNADLPAALKKPTDETIELLKSIMPKLAQLEKETIDSSQRLFPRIKESVRAVQMQNAYQTGYRVS